MAMRETIWRAANITTDKPPTGLAADYYGFAALILGATAFIAVAVLVIGLSLARGVKTRKQRQEWSVEHQALVIASRQVSKSPGSSISLTLSKLEKTLETFPNGSDIVMIYSSTVILIIVFFKKIR